MANTKPFDENEKINRELRTEEENINKLSTLYKQGLESKDQIDHNHAYNILITILCASCATLIGVIICYLIYVYC